MNISVISGNLTRDPEPRKTSSERTVVQLCVAVSRPRKNGEDQGADFVDVTTFGTLADNCLKYLSKGRKVGVEGHLHHSRWESENGRRQKLEVVAHNVDFLSPPPTSSDNGHDTPTPVGAVVDDGEDIPF
jgi:single-strand DNA-binding protein